MKLFGNMNIKNNSVYIGKYNVNDLADEYGTPLYMMDLDYLKDNISLYIDKFRSQKLETRVLYASKALLNLYMARLVEESGLYIDVVSEGEMYICLKAGLNPKKMYLHGNNKGLSGLEMAINNVIGTIVMDNRDEYIILSKLINEKYPDKVIRVLLRLNPGVEAHTHEYIKTAKNDSKFGLSIYDESTEDLIKELISNKNIDFAGVHVHIGSQIFEKESFFDAARHTVEYLVGISKKLDVHISEINFGGGFGVYNYKDDNPFNLEEFLGEYIKKIQIYTEEFDLNIDIVSIEPGRSIVCNPGSTIYTVGGSKKTHSGKNYVFVDGGITDNPRYALYQAKYEAIIANKAEEETIGNYDISGMACESGDILIRDYPLAKPEINDRLLINSTGAYNYSMRSNYNMALRPAMIFISKDKVELAVKRQKFEDLLNGQE